MQERVRVLKPTPGDELFLRSFGDQVSRVATELTTILLPRDPLTPRPDVVIHTWREYGASAPLMVQLVEDRKLPRYWLSVRGSTEEQRDAAIEVMDRMMPVMTRADLKRAAAHPERQPDFLIMLALGLDGRRDRGVPRLIRDALASNRGDVRIAAASAAGMLRWSDLVPVLSEALSREGDEAAKRVLEAAMAECERAGTGAGEDQR
jgi:hypothetical protein